MRNTKEIAQMSRYEILDTLIEDKYEINPSDAADISATIQQAARAGALVWTDKHIVSTLVNRSLRLTKGK